VLGTQVYDARLVAVMLAHGIGCILTFNITNSPATGSRCCTLRRCR